MSNYTRQQLARISELDAAIDTAADQSDDVFFAAVAANDEYIDAQGIDRDRLEVTGREASKFIEHLASGKTGTFSAKYDQHAERNGQTFTVLGAVDPTTYDADECGPLYSIRFADGAEVEAWSEEVESARVVRSPVDRLCQSGHNPT